MLIVKDMVYSKSATLLVAYNQDFNPVKNLLQIISFGFTVKY